MRELSTELRAAAKALEHEYPLRSRPAEIAWADLVAAHAERLLGEWGGLTDPQPADLDLAVRTAANRVERGPIDPSPPEPDRDRLAGADFLSGSPLASDFVCPNCKERIARPRLPGWAELPGKITQRDGIYPLKVISQVTRARSRTNDLNESTLIRLPAKVRCRGKRPGHGAPSCRHILLVTDGGVQDLTAATNPG